MKFCFLLDFLSDLSSDVVLFISAGLDHWEVVCNGGDGFVAEETPAGCKQICECTSVKGKSRKLFGRVMVI